MQSLVAGALANPVGMFFTDVLTHPELVNALLRAQLILSTIVLVELALRFSKRLAALFTIALDAFSQITIPITATIAKLISLIFRAKIGRTMSAFEYIHSLIITRLVRPLLLYDY